MAEVPAIDFNLIPDKQVTAAILNPYDRITWPHRSQMHINLANTQIRQVISSGIREGKSYADMAKDIKSRVDVTAGKAQTIARTEGHRAREMGKLAATQKAHDQGLIFKRRWVATLDKDTRDTHGAMDGQEIDVYDENGNPGVFESPEGGTTEFPGGFGRPEEDINCRCTTVDIYAGFEPKERRTREDDMIPYATYQQYAKAKGWPTPYAGFEPRVVAQVIGALVAPSKPAVVSKTAKRVAAEAQQTVLTTTETEQRIAEARALLKKKRELQRLLRDINRKLGL
jgi:SPP1 gp7 family putative phage head morphogenesis protein